MRFNKWLMLAVALSVGLNVVGVGFFAGRASHGLHPSKPDPTIGFMRMVKNLPDARRHELRPLARELRRQLAPKVTEMHGAQHRLSTVILADPYDEEALQEALTALRQHLNTIHVASHETFMKLVVQLSSSERQVLVDLMRTARPTPPGPRFSPKRERGPARERGDTSDSMFNSEATEHPGVPHSSTHPIRHQLHRGSPPAHRNL